MFKFKQGKSLIKLALVLMLVALTAFSCLFVYNNVKYERVDNPQAAAKDIEVDYSKLSASEVYAVPSQDGNGWEMVLDNYDKYKYFSVRDYQSLRQFGHSVQAGCDYSGKVVFMTGDISFENGLWRPIGLWEQWNVSEETIVECMGDSDDPFRGVFDGRGHLLKLATYNLTSESTAYYYGLFARIENAVVKNVRISYTLGKSNDPVDLAEKKTYGIGAVAGWSESCIIKNCVVNKLEVHANFIHSGDVKCNISGITNTEEDKDEASTQIRECYVSNVTIDARYDPEFKTALRVRASGIAVQSGDGDTIMDNCVVNNGKYSLGGYSNWTLRRREREEDGSIYDDDLVNLDHDCVSYHTGKENGWWYSLYHNLNPTIKQTVYYDVDDDFANLDTKKWFIPTSDVFNDGWPYLRYYMEFNKYTFVPNDKTYGTVAIDEGVQYIEVPKKDVDETNIDCVTSFKSSTAEVSYFFGVKITATPATGYYLSGWEINANKQTELKAKFAKENYTLNVKIQNPNGVDITSSVSGTKSFKVKYYQTIKLGIGSSGLNTAIINNGTDTICVVDGKYEIDSFKINGTAYANVPDLGNNNTSHTITIKLKLKSYGVEIK